MSSLEEIIRVPTPLVEIQSPDFKNKRVRVYVKCDYETHVGISGNKWRKLKYNLFEAKRLQQKTILSFGGAYSNHIYALGAVSKFTDFEVHAFIRGDELQPNSNKTLSFAHENGVKLHFVSRERYRDKQTLAQNFGTQAFVIPEGGSNKFALRGVSEMVDELLAETPVTHICAAMGTGGTVAGILSNGAFEGEVIGIPVLKGGKGLLSVVQHLLDFPENQLAIADRYHFGGYGKSTKALKEFQQQFFEAHGIPLDRIYTAKLFYAVMDLIRTDFFAPDSRIVIYHSGGLRPGNLY